MKKTLVVLLGVLLGFWSAGASAAPGGTLVPDTTLEAAIEAVIGDDGVAGAVDTEWLVGTGAGYAGPADGLTILGLVNTGDGIEIAPLEGVADLTGLEDAANFQGLFTINSDVASYAPIAGLESLIALGVIDGGFGDAQLAEVMAGSASLMVFFLANLGGATPNTMTQTGLAALAAGAPDLVELVLSGLGQEYDLTVLSGLPLGAMEILGLGLFLQGNTLAGFGSISNFTGLRTLGLSGTGMTSANLAEISWSSLTSLADLILAQNQITEVTPLLDLIGNAAGTAIVLDDNPLSTPAVCADIPTLVGAGFTVSTENVEPCGIELNLQVTGTGQTSPASGIRRFPEGTEVIVSAQPVAGSGWAFQEWQGDLTGTDTNRTLVMDANKTVTAVFTDTGDLLTITVGTEGAGSGDTAPPAGVYSYLRSTATLFAAFPAPGSFFDGWRVTVDVPGEGIVELPRDYREVRPVDFSEIDPPIAIATMSAVFADSGHVLTVETQGEGNTDPRPGAYPLAAGAVRSLEATPDPGWEFARWEDGLGATVSTDNPLDVEIVDADLTRRAVFVESGYRLTLISAGTGSGATLPASGPDPGIVYAYPDGDSVSLLALPNADSVFVGWSGDLPAGADPADPILEIVMDQNRVITAIFDAADHVLTVNVVGQGAVVLANRIQKGPGVFGFLDGETARLGAALTPGTGHAFQEWTGDTAGDALLFDQAILMDGDKSVTAVFSEQSAVPVTVLSADPAKGTTSPAPGDYAYRPGQLTFFSAVPLEGFVFAGWSLETDAGGGYVDSGRTYVTPVLAEPVGPHPTRVTAHFGENPATLTILEPVGEGQTYPLPGSYELASGTAVTLTATPEDVWEFQGWYDGEGTLVSGSPVFPVILDGTMTYQARFSIPTFTLTLYTAGAGTGTLVPAGSPDGETYDLPISTAVTLTAIPDSNSVFTGWSGDLPPGTVPDVPVLNVVMNQNRTITATFVPADFTLTVNVAGTANPVNVTPPPGVYGYLAGQTAVVIALPASGSPAAFDLWTGSAITNNAIVPLTMDSNKVMTANYVDDNGSNTFGLTVTAPGGDGSGAYFPLSPGSYRVLSNRTLFFGANPNPGSFFGGWTGSYAGVNTPQELAVRMDQDRTVGAVFSATGTTVTVALSGQGDVFPRPGVYAFADGLVVPFTGQRINSTWVFDSWQDAVGGVYATTSTYNLTVDADMPGMFITGVFAEDSEAPVLACGGDRTLEPNGACEWIVPDYTGDITVTDDYGPIFLGQAPLAGTVIAGPTLVVITARDASTLSPNSTCSFLVNPVDTAGFCTQPVFGVDQDGDQDISLTELMRIIQFYNTPGGAYSCTESATEDGYQPGAGDTSCAPNAADLDGDFSITLSELLRIVQFYNAGGYFYCGVLSPDGDGFCAGQASGVRLVHAAFETPSVDLCANGLKVLSDLSYGQVTAALGFPENAYDLGLVPAGGDCADTPVIAMQQDFWAGSDQTLVVAGPSADLSWFVFSDDAVEPAPGNARVRVIHVNHALETVDCGAVTPGPVLFADDISYGEQRDAVEVSAGDYTLAITTSDGLTTLLGGLAITLEDGINYSLVLGGNGIPGFQPVILAK
ncbi:MAG TPA: DUF4397 domain-containing protein [Candidatus Hydrogenedentes bacterium]|nr:DUF4397 domain-containing protein [Candidatus Hydrogenedentota bacterium]